MSEIAVPSIPRAVFLETAPPPEEKIGVVPPRAENQPPEKKGAWRVAEPELPDMLEWLVPSLRAQWPAAIEDGILFWTRMALNNANICFVRSEHTAAAAQITRSFLEPRGIVEDIFFAAKAGLARDKLRVERTNAYYLMKNWAKAIGARHFRIACSGDTAFIGERMRWQVTATVGIVTFPLKTL